MRLSVRTIDTVSTHEKTANENNKWNYVVQQLALGSILRVYDRCILRVLIGDGEIMIEVVKQPIISHLQDESNDKWLTLAQLQNLTSINFVAAPFHDYDNSSADPTEDGYS